MCMQYMTHRNRRGCIERGAQLLNQRSADRVVPLLCAMAAKWQRELQEAAIAQETVLLALAHYHGISREQASVARPVR